MHVLAIKISFYLMLTEINVPCPDPPRLRILKDSSDTK